MRKKRRDGEREIERRDMYESRDIGHDTYMKIISDSFGYVGEVLTIELTAQVYFRKKKSDHVVVLTQVDQSIERD